MSTEYSPSIFFRMYSGEPNLIKHLNVMKIVLLILDSDIEREIKYSRIMAKNKSVYFVEILTFFLSRMEKRGGNNSISPISEGMPPSNLIKTYLKIKS